MRGDPLPAVTSVGPPGLTSSAPLIEAETSLVEAVTVRRTSVISDLTSAMIGSTSSSRCFCTKVRGLMSSSNGVIAQLAAGAGGRSAPTLLSSASALPAAERHRGPRLGVPPLVLQDHLLTRAPGADLHDQLLGLVNSSVVDLAHQITRPEAGPPRRTVAIDRGELEAPAHFAQVSADHWIGRLAVGDQQVGDRLGLVDRDGEANPDVAGLLVAAAAGQDGRVDADHSGLGV